MSIEITIRTTVDSDWIDTLIDMAGYGITYWAESAHWNGKVYAITVQSEFVGPSGWHGENGEPLMVAREYVLTPEALASAVADIARGELTASYIAEYARKALLDTEDGACDIDSELADCAVQVACFGRLYFG
jgi:hypothetical protein